MLFINNCKKVLTGFLFFISLLIISISCDSAEPPSNQTLTLKLEDVSCTEAWLQLKTNNLQLPNNITLFINDLQSRTYNLTTADTLLFIDSLLPNQNYSFQLISFYNPEDGIKSNKVTATTLDTTSHNFTWQTFTFGQHSSSTLYDVAIINENDIWAVGEIYMNDSLGNPDPNSYNAVHWNGQSWELIKTGGYGGYPRRTVFAFSANDVWFDGVIKWDGANYAVHMNGWPLMPNGDGWQVNKMWGSSSNDLYAVGNNGNIAHYQNGSWTKIESNTDLHIRDIYGSSNPGTNQTNIICIASQSLLYPYKKLIKINQGNVEILPDSGLPRNINTIWFKSGSKYCIGGAGYYESRYLLPVWVKDPGSPNVAITTIRGRDINDIFIGGVLGLLRHFNGMTWEDYTWLTTYYADVISSVAVSENRVVCVGFKDSKAVIIVGSR